MGKKKRKESKWTRNRLERKRREGGEGRKRKRGRRRVSGAAVTWAHHARVEGDRNVGQRRRGVRVGTVEGAKGRRARRGVRSGLVGAFNYLRRAKRSRSEILCSRSSRIRKKTIWKN